MLRQTEGGIPEVECPHCKMIVELTAEVDSSYPATGSVELLWTNGEVTINWDTLDADISFQYNCPYCGASLGASLKELTELVKSQSIN